MRDHFVLVICASGIEHFCRVASCLPFCFHLGVSLTTGRTRSNARCPYSFLRSLGTFGKRARSGDPVFTFVNSANAMATQVVCGDKMDENCQNRAIKDKCNMYLLISDTKGARANINSVCFSQDKVCRTTSRAVFWCIFNRIRYYKAIRITSCVQTTRRRITTSLAVNYRRLLRYIKREAPINSRCRIYGKMVYRPSGAVFGNFVAAQCGEMSSNYLSNFSVGRQVVRDVSNCRRSFRFTTTVSRPIFDFPSCTTTIRTLLHSTRNKYVCVECSQVHVRIGTLRREEFCNDESTWAIRSISCRSYSFAFLYLVN